MITYDENRSALIAEISGRADVTHAAIEAMLSALEEMGCTVVDSPPKLDFVHALITPTSGPDMLLAEQQDRKAAALAVIEDLRRQLDEVTAERDAVVNERNADRSVEPLAAVAAECDKFRQHSITLNALCWKIVTALGEIPDHIDAIMDNPFKTVDRLIARHVDAQPVLEAARAWREWNDVPESDEECNLAVAVDAMTSGATDA